jgi:hypothetical protein
MTKNEAKPAIAVVNELCSKSPDGLREIVGAVMQEMLGHPPRVPLSSIVVATALRCARKIESAFR